MNRNILVYKNQPLPISETFVYNQCFRLKRYRAYMLGAKWPRGPAIPLPPDRVRVLNAGGISGLWQEIRWKVLAQVPAEVLRWARRLQPALLHAHFGPDGAVAMPLAKALGIPLVVSFHGTDATMKDGHVWRHSYITNRLYLLRRQKLRQAACRIIVQSDFLRWVVVEQQRFPEEKIVCIRYGVDVQTFRPYPERAEFGHLLYVGRLINRKGLPFLLQALHRVKEQFPSVHLTVIGDGPSRIEYESMAKTLLGSQVTFLGAQPQDVVRAYLERAYLFCMPSITMPSGEAESLGMVFLEAMAMKVPPVSFRSGGIPEVILHGETGFLAEERNVEELAHYISLLLENPELRQAMGEAGRKWVEQEFNLATQNEKLEALYDEVITESLGG
ncbi:MAG: glycosyltransferase [Armatimonadota bacterium]